MRDIFELIWNGDVTPHKTCGSKDPAVQELEQLLCRNKETLDTITEGAQKEQLEGYVACREEYTYRMLVHAFREGFSLACRLMTESLGQ